MRYSKLTNIYHALKTELIEAEIKRELLDLLAFLYFITLLVLGNHLIPPFEFSELVQLELAHSVQNNTFSHFPEWRNQYQFFQLPFYSWLLAIWVDSFGNSIFPLRSLSSLINIISIFIFYFFIVLDRNTSKGQYRNIFLLFCISPTFIILSRIISPQPFVFLFSVICFFKMKDIFIFTIQRKYEEIHILPLALGLLGCLIFNDTLILKTVLSTTIAAALVGFFHGLYQQKNIVLDYISESVINILKILFLVIIFFTPFLFSFGFLSQKPSLMQDHFTNVPFIGYLLCDVFGSGSPLCNIPAFIYLNDYFFGSLGAEYNIDSLTAYPIILVFLISSLLLIKFLYDGAKEIFENFKENLNYLYSFFFFFFLFIYTVSIPYFKIDRVLLFSIPLVYISFFQLNRSKINITYFKTVSMFSIVIYIILNLYYIPYLAQENNSRFQKIIELDKRMMEKIQTPHLHH